MAAAAAAGSDHDAGDGGGAGGAGVGAAPRPAACSECASLSCVMCRCRRPGCQQRFCRVYGDIGQEPPGGWLDRA